MSTQVQKTNQTFQDYNKEQIDIIKNQVAKNTTDLELKYFLSVCTEVSLSPILKEIWCYKDGRGNLVVFSGRDGYHKNAKKSEDYKCVISSEVRENDKFTFNPLNIEETKHELSAKERGSIVGAYAIVIRKDGFRSGVYVDFSEYNKKQGAWLTNPSAMIKKVAETNALKTAYPISGLTSEYDYQVIDNVAIPIDMTIKIHDIEEIKAKVSELNNRDELGIYYKSLDIELQGKQEIIGIFTERALIIENE